MRDSSVGRTFLSAACLCGGQACPPHQQAATRFAPSLNHARKKTRVVFPAVAWNVDRNAYHAFWNLAVGGHVTATVFSRGRVDLGGCPPRPPTDPDLPVKEASGSSSHDFATPPTRPWITRARGRLYRSSRRENLDHGIRLPRRRRDSHRRQIPRAASRNSWRQ